MDKIKDIFMLEDANISRKGLLRISLEEQKVEALGQPVIRLPCVVVIRSFIPAVKDMLLCIISRGITYNLVGFGALIPYIPLARSPVNLVLVHANKRYFLASVSQCFGFLWLSCLKTQGFV